MPQPLAICIEDLQCSPGSSRYTTCVVVGGGEPGLGVDSRGQLAWRQEGPLACLLCVSLDEQLILLRPEGAPSVRVERAGRSLDVPVGKPVVLLDQDRFETAGRSLRVHVHGVVKHVAPPAQHVEGHARGVLATTLALSVAAAACQGAVPVPSTPGQPDATREAGKPAPIEVRPAPPVVAIPPPPPSK